MIDLLTVGIDVNNPSISKEGYPIGYGKKQPSSAITGTQLTQEPVQTMFLGIFRNFRYQTGILSTMA
jgi:hypothetical protein